MAAQLNRYLGYHFSYLMEKNIFNSNSQNFLSKFSSSIGRDKTYNKYNTINSSLLVEQFNKNISRSIITVKLSFVFLQIFLMENKTPVKKKNNSIMVNVAPLMLRGILVSNTD